ncbi:MAG: UvrD-helicase domain-containing protein [Hyphomicrobiaceae bacterium]
MTLVDAFARARALTDIDSTMLVEAAAGTGKTALIAGRLTMLLVRGTPPRDVAAITFTELAASALSARVHRYVGELLAGKVPSPLREAFPDGLSEAQRKTLSLAAANLDELTASTIHGFCQSIITAYAVEADADPGARILDAGQQEASFKLVFERWLKRRLGAPETPGDPIAILSRDDPREVASLLLKLASFRAEHRTASVPAADFAARSDTDLMDAVTSFRRWLASQPPEPKTLALVDELETLAVFFADAFAGTPDFARLWPLSRPQRLSCMRAKTFDLLRPELKGAWQKAAGRDAGARLNEEAENQFDRVDLCYRAVLGTVAASLVAGLSGELDEVLVEYGTFKRAAAVLDFDDLLHIARALVRNHEPVRRALGERYRYIFVDEFQDTDPVQCEILFRIASDAQPPAWQDSVPRAGALFLVGDPKQAIYKFRGADIGCYLQAREVISRGSSDNIVQVTANFRSRPEILAHINRCFEAALSAPGQPGYVALSPTVVSADHGLPSAAKIKVDAPPGAKAAREAEADAVAELCTRLIGNIDVRNEQGELVPLPPGGIALLAPAGTDLWYYERALEEKGLPIASQAGKGLFRRQEVQDLLALARTLADARDTLAFGALMRGPLIGLTEEELLDIAHALPVPSGRDGLGRFSVLTDPAHVAHTGAGKALTILQELRRRSGSTTPQLLLAEAVERLRVRPILAARGEDRSPRSAANIDAFLERARPYGVKGLKHFIGDISRAWEEGEAATEGSIDAEGDAIEVITIHSAKGLEWPVVIPINTVSWVRSREQFIHRASDDTMHWLLGEVVPPSFRAALRTDEDAYARERERLWYVACTRARDLLVIPELPAPDQRSWARIIDLGLRELPLLDVSGLKPAAFAPTADPPNLQDPETFAAETARIETASVPVAWRRPSDGDPDRAPIIEGMSGEDDAPEVEAPEGAGRVRGLLLHKLMEEVLMGELREEVDAFCERARELLFQLRLESPANAPEADEIGATAWRTLQLPEIAALRSRLVAELPVYAWLKPGPQGPALAGRIDAAAIGDSRPEVIVDWKSDVAPRAEDIAAHAAQLQDYLRATGAPRGALVYMTTGSVRWLDLAPDR